MTIGQTVRVNPTAEFRVYIGRIGTIIDSYHSSSGVVRYEVRFEQAGDINISSYLEEELELVESEATYGL